MSLIALVGVSAVTAAKAWIIQPVGDALFDEGMTSVQLLGLCGLIAGLFGVQALLNFVHAVVAKVAGARIVRTIRRDLFAHLLRQDRAYFVTRTSSDLVSRVVNDVVRFESTAASAVQNIVRDAVTLVLLFGVMLLHSWRLSLFSVGAVAIIGWFLMRMNQRIRTLSRRTQESISAVVRQLSEVIGGIEVVLTYRVGDRWRERFEKVNQDYYRTTVHMERTSAAVMSVIQLVIGVGIAVILLITGQALIAGEMTEGEFLSFLGAGYLLQTPVMSIGGQILNFAKGLAGGERALALLDDEPKLTDAVDPVSLPSVPLDIEFRGVCFAYEQEPILDDVSFSIEAGERVVLVGESGAGKTTLAKLLLRFDDPSKGEIRLGGVPLPRMDRASLYRATAYVSQDVFLFETTIRENLLVGAPGASDDELAEAIRLVGLDELVGALPDGIDTEVRERGLRLSGGQRQRLAIARALVCGAEILVLDEATSALDMDSERRILESLFKAPVRRTIVGISHRLSVAYCADRVLSLKRGRIVEDGPAHVLAERDGEFARLCRAAGGSPYEVRGAAHKVPRPT